jgi:hypothetical protein
MTDDFNSRLGFLPFNVIQSIYNEHKIIELNNVLEGFKSDFFTIALDKKESIEEYTLIYICGSDEIRGLTLRSGRNVKERDLNTFRFAKAIENEFPEKNTISIFNTFQNKLIEAYESFGILCLPEYIATLGKELTFLLPNKPKIGVDHILQINPIEFYRSFFERKDKIQDKVGISKLYLMCEGEKGYIKIGQTKNNLETRRKGVAEPTLNAKDPQIWIISAWEAPKEVEKKLHSDYKSKRKRGEWFDLKAVDLKEINEMMLIYKMIDIKKHES